MCSTPIFLLRPQVSKCWLNDASIPSDSAACTLAIDSFPGFKGAMDSGKGTAGEASWPYEPMRKGDLQLLVFVAGDGGSRLVVVLEQGRQARRMQEK